MLNQENIYPSHALVEKTLLAMFINDGSRLYPYILRIKPVFFHVPTYHWVYTEMVNLAKNNSPFDEPILCHQLKVHYPEHNWDKELEELKIWVEEEDKIPLFIQKLEENYVNRTLVQVALKISDFTVSEDERLNSALLTLLDLKNLLEYKEEVPLNKLLLRFIAQGRMTDPRDLVQTGLKKLDPLLGGGMEKKQMVVVGARPGMGKTAFLLSMCNKLLDEGKHKILYVSLASPPSYFLTRMLANRLNFPLHKIAKGELPPNYDASLNQLWEMEKSGKFKYHYHTNNDFTSLMAEINSHKIRYGLDVVMIDNLQMLDEINIQSHQNRHQTLGRNLRKLKQMAYEHNFLLVMGSDLSRSTERRSSFSYRPLLADLKDSGWIEELADKVLMIYRPEYYQLAEWEDGESTKDTGEIIISKNSLGPLEMVRVKYHTESFLFEDLHEDNYMVANDWTIPQTRSNEF
jgi:replicative DNA helicase